MLTLTFATLNISTPTVQFPIRNSSLISQVESQKPAGALDSCSVRFGTLQQCEQFDHFQAYQLGLNSNLRHKISNLRDVSERFYLLLEVLTLNYSINIYFLQNPILYPTFLKVSDNL